VRRTGCHGKRGLYELLAKVLGGDGEKEFTQMNTDWRG
jgi:hypothetical protein